MSTARLLSPERAELLLTDSLAVVCARNGGAWEPVYAVRDGVQEALPQCFTLNPQARAAILAAERQGEAK